MASLKNEILDMLGAFGIGRSEPEPRPLQMTSETSKTVGTGEVPPIDKPSHYPELFDSGDYIRFARDQAVQHGFDPKLVQAIMRQESSYDRKAVSKDGAKGLMQLMPGAIADVKELHKYEVIDPFDPVQNILGGIKYLDVIKNTRIPRMFKNRGIKDVPIDDDALLAAYNWGPTAFAKHVKKYGKKWKDVPIPLETRGYIDRISRLRSQL